MQLQLVQFSGGKEVRGSMDESQESTFVLPAVLKESKPGQKKKGRGVRGEQRWTCYHVTEARFDLTLNTQMCMQGHTRTQGHGA